MTGLVSGNAVNTGAARTLNRYTLPRDSVVCGLCACRTINQGDQRGK